MEPATDPNAWPMADPALTQEILDLFNQATHYHQVKKGINEATKAATRDMSELVVLAGDTDPIAIVMHLPLICDDKNVPYVFVPSQMALGRACGVSRPVAAATIISNYTSDPTPQIRQLREKVERIAI